MRVCCPGGANCSRAAGRSGWPLEKLRHRGFWPRLTAKRPPLCPAEIVYALTTIVGIGRRLSYLLCKKAGINPNLRAGQVTPEQYEKVVAILADPLHYKIPTWFLNRRNDFVTGKTYQIYSNQIATTLRDDIERMKKARIHRGIRHYWGLKVRGQRTCTTGRGAVKLMHH